MPHNQLQDALAYLHTLYATYEAQGITITGSRMPLTQYANFAAMKYLLFLANQDRVITDAETNFINNCLQQSATTQTMERFLQQFSISFSGAADSLLALLAALVRVDLQGSGVEGSISLLWLETIAQMGTQFSLNTAGKVEPQQQIVQNSMMQQLSRYRDAAMRGCRHPELEKAAVIPADFNAEKPPIPAEKEAVVDDAEITEAPTETLDELLAQSDLISLHCPLTEQTKYLINDYSISKMKDGVMIINTGRGQLIHTNALIEGLKNKKIGSAGLDVYEEESEYFYEDQSDKIIDDDTLARLLSFNNVIVTSHQAFFTREALANIASTTLQNIKDFMNHKPLEKEVKA